MVDESHLQKLSVVVGSESYLRQERLRDSDAVSSLQAGCKFDRQGAMDGYTEEGALETGILVACLVFAQQTTRNSRVEDM